ncbi:MAG: hypothetical protein AAF658_13815, partial [Myxococcota bacterium]
MTELFTVAVRVFDSAVVDAMVKVATPEALVVVGGLIVFPVPVEPSATEAPATGFELPSRTVTVTVEVDEPSATTLRGAAETVERLALTEPAVKVTLAVVVNAFPSTRAVSVFVSAVVDEIVPVARPALLVVPGSTMVLPGPVDSRVTAAPG